MGSSAGMCRGTGRKPLCLGTCLHPPRAVRVPYRGAADARGVVRRGGWGVTTSSGLTALGQHWRRGRAGWLAASQVQRSEAGHMDPSASSHCSKVPTVTPWPCPATNHFLSSSTSTRTKTFPGPHTLNPAVLHSLIRAPVTPGTVVVTTLVQSWDFLSPIAQATVIPCSVWSKCSPGPARPSEGHGDTEQAR